MPVTNRPIESLLTPAAQADPVFDRDTFLLRQKVIAIREKYSVTDERGQAVAYVERPRHLFRNLGAALVAIVAGVLAMAAVGSALDATGAGSGLAAGFGALLGLATILTLAIALSKKRHAIIYRGSDKREPLVEIRQDRKFQIIHATFTVRDAQGVTLARLRKNYLYDVIRKRWDVLTPDGRSRFVAREDSILLSILRRLVGPLFGLLRTDFIIQDVDAQRLVGLLKRKFTILDRYVLDLTPDFARTLDRRVALALGIMLDTGERR